MPSSAVQPVFKTAGSRPSASQHKQQLKRLQFVASYAEYWWGKVCNVYMAGRQLAPGNLSQSINFMEDKFVAMTLPFFMAVQQQSFEALCQMDAKVCCCDVAELSSKHILCDHVFVLWLGWISVTALCGCCKCMQ